MSRLGTAAVLTWLALAALPLSAEAASFSASATGAGPIDTAVLGDTASLTGGVAASGTITFSVWGPDDPSCVGAALASHQVPVSGDGDYKAPDFYPEAIGVFHWRAAYSGDGVNAAASVDCAAASQAAEVTRAKPALLTTASGSAEVGQPISDTARLSGGDTNTGTITFALFGPDDSGCTTQISSSVVGVSERRAVSNPYTPAAPGLYRWIASYSGDAHDDPVSAACGDQGESVTVGPRSVAMGPLLSLEQGQDTTVGSALASAVQLGGSASTGTLTFRYFGPDDAQCERGAVAATSRGVIGTGRYLSDPFTPPVAGRWIVVVQYTGDDGSVASTSCFDPLAAVRVSPTPEPVPVLAETFKLDRVSGSVFVRVPASGARRSARSAAGELGFFEVTHPTSVPLGSTVDTRSGTASVTTARTSRTVQAATFRGARFVVHQTRAAGARTDIDLRPLAGARKICARASLARAAKRKPLPASVLAKLRTTVSAKGNFRTRGRYSNASVKGTSWVMIERCDGTLTIVRSGAVLVFDRGKGRSVAVRRGQRYLARAAR